MHWANDGDEACSIVAGIAHADGFAEVVKVKSIATDEIQLNEAPRGSRGCARSRPTWPS